MIDQGYYLLEYLAGLICVVIAIFLFGTWWLGPAEDID